MNSLQRVQAAIARHPPDRVPKGEFLVERAFAEAFLRAAPANRHLRPALGSGPLEPEIAFSHQVGADLICVHHDLLKGAGWAQTGAEVLRRAAAEGLFVFSVRNGGFQTLQNQTSLREVLLAAARDPEAVARQLLQQAKGLARQMESDIAAGAHGILVAEDFAYPGGLYVSPRLVETALLPCWREWVGAARQLGVPVFLHSDGNLQAALPAIFEAGFDGLQGLEPAAGMDFAAVRKTGGGELCLMGNLDPALLLPDGPNPGLPETGQSFTSAAAQDPYPVLSRTMGELFATAGSGGGFLFGTCSGLFPDLSPAKVLYAYQLAERLGSPQP